MKPETLYLYGKQVICVYIDGDYLPDVKKILQE